MTPVVWLGPGHHASNPRIRRASTAKEPETRFFELTVATDGCQNVLLQAPPQRA